MEGRSGSEFEEVRRIAKENPVFFSKLIDLLTEAVIIHAKEQIASGAQIIQIFDSWAGILSGDSYERWAIQPAIKIIEALKEAYPDVPLIAFPRQSGSRFIDYVKATKVQAVSFDNSVTLDWVKHHLQPHCVVQGNLSPEILAGDQKTLLEEARKIIFALADKPFVFNLGHGIFASHACRKYAGT